MPARSNLMSYALFANAAAVALVGYTLLSKTGGPSLLPAAMAQQAPQPIAGGAGLFLMPGQLSASTWGCYVMDVDRQTLMAYQYEPGRNLLLLRAARDFSYDRRLHNFNTGGQGVGLAPSEVKQLVESEAANKPPAGQ